jgi:hypothetical protein
MRIIRPFNIKQNTIYVDMDGVIADFDAFVLKHMGRTYGANEPGGTHKDQELWDFLENVPNLYRQLEPTPYAYDLWNLVQSFGANVEILTAIPRRASTPASLLATSEQDKRDWMAHYFNADVKVNLGPLSKDKWKHASPGDILIDDRRDNIQDWHNVGGVAILHDYENYGATASRLIDIRDKALAA